MERRHNLQPTLHQPVNIISDRRGILAGLPERHPLHNQPIKVKRGWPGVIVGQCRCGCATCQVVVLNLVDVILPAEILRKPVLSHQGAA